MKAYTLHYFWHDLLSKKYRLDFSFALPQKETVERTRIFATEHEARQYLEEDKATWLKTCIEHVILQAEKVVQNQQEESRKKSLELCKGFYNDIADKKDIPLIGLCNRFMKGENHFRKIVLSSPEEKTLLSGIDEIKTFCQSETNSTALNNAA